MSDREEQPPTEAVPETTPLEEDFRDKYLRLLAESENMRKRLHKEKQEAFRLAQEQMAAEFLPAIDNLDQALKFADQMSAEVKNWAMGFRMILSQMQDVLANHGIVPFDSVGKPFDPYLHEAVEVEISTEQPAGTILREMVRGYRSREHTVRAARVVVAKAPEDKETTQSE